MYAKLSPRGFVDSASQQNHISAWRRHGVGSMRDGRHRARDAQVASMAVTRLVFLLP